MPICTYTPTKTGDAYQDAARADAATRGTSDEDRRAEQALADAMRAGANAIGRAMNAEYSHAEVDRMMVEALEAVLRDWDENACMDVGTLSQCELAVAAYRGRA